MSSRNLAAAFGLMVLLLAAAAAARAQSFRVQCPTSTLTHPDTTATQLVNSTEPSYMGPTSFTLGADGYQVPTTGTVNGAIKCQQISGGDGYATMGDGTQTYMFSFGPLSGLTQIMNGNPGTEPPSTFNTIYGGVFAPGDPATTLNSAGGSFAYDGAVGLTVDSDCLADNAAATAAGTALPCPNTPSSGIDGHVDARSIMDVGVMNGNIPAPLMAIDEDDEFFLTLTNVGMIMRPDLFEQHTVHFHGYPNASSFYDGVPDASVAINIGGSFTYYYLAPDAGTYFWHCHITPPEHLQMGMVGQIYVRPRQDRVPTNTTLNSALLTQQQDLRTACRRPNDGASPVVTDYPDVLCTNPIPAITTTATGGYIAPTQAGVPGTMTKLYAYNDGDGSTQYDVEYPLQIHGFDPNFHFVGMTFNPEGFADMKDKYFLLNGRSYPDTVTEGAMQTVSADGASHFSQPLPAVINIPVGGRALLRISDLDVSEYQTLSSLGIRMNVIGYNAKLLRDQEGNNLNYLTNSITLGGGESLDVILDASVPKPDGTPYSTGEVYYLYTTQLDHLANDAENFGGLMTEVHICGSVDPSNKLCGK